MTECSQSQFPFEAHFSRQVMGRFDGSQLTTDGGGLLLRQADRKIGLLQRVTACFTDHRRRERVEHELHQMLAQRIYGLALGYEDLNDHEQLREDPLLALLAGKREITEPLAGKSTLNRMELTPAGSALAERYHKITYSAEAIDALLVEIFLEAHRKPPTEIVLDLDATDTPLHGRQEGRFFHGYYNHYCYLPLYVFCGDHLLCARLRPSNQDPSAGSLEEVARIVAQIRKRWPKVRNRAASRLGLLSPGADGVVRDARRGLCIRLRAQPAATAHRPRHAGSQAGAPPHGEAGARVHRVLLSHAGQLVAGAARGGQGRADRRQGTST